jgi:hypothetical protein
MKAKAGLKVNRVDTTWHGNERQYCYKCGDASNYSEKGVSWTLAWPGLRSHAVL